MPSKQTKITKSPKPKKCRVCKGEFRPFQTMQKACSPGCALELVKKGQEKVARKELREGRQRLKTKSEWLREAQNAFNRYIRLRDKKEACISCSREHDGQYHAGHYRTVGAHPELRFCEDNCHKQCAPCNNHKSGNVVEYRINLKQKIGSQKLEWLEGPHEPKHYTEDEIKEIKSKYSKMARELEKQIV